MSVLFDLPGIRVLGNRWEFAIEVSDAQGQPKDLTNATVTMAIGESPAAPYVQKVADIADQADEQGVATAVFLPSETAPIQLPRSKKLFYQVNVSYGADNIDTVATGYFRVQQSLI